MTVSVTVYPSQSRTACSGPLSSHGSFQFDSSPASASGDAKHVTITHKAHPGRTPDAPYAMGIWMMDGNKEKIPINVGRMLRILPTATVQ